MKLNMKTAHRSWLGRLVLVVAGVSLSAGAGALVQSKLNVKQLAPEQLELLNQAQERDALYLQQSVQQLAQRVGDLQAKVIEMEQLGRRVADSAGVMYTDPEVTQQMDMGEDYPVVSTAQDLGRQLDDLNHSLSQRQDWLTMLDTVLSHRLANQARFPAAHPVDVSYATSNFGWRRHPITGRHKMHEGMDFSAPVGTPIVAASGGIVTEARYLSGYGKTVEITHGDGLITRYAHASSIVVRLGDVVEKGQMIARVGATGRTTGAHLHFEVRLENQALDPMLFLPQGHSGSLVAQSAKTE
ncbi:MAG TPA: M23 family metallopeptidase [Alcaligenaceae bacterium]|nr:M23 family metallopeptidase [Alcaligenaceae bacterium]